MVCVRRTTVLEAGTFLYLNCLMTQRPKDPTPMSTEYCAKFNAEYTDEKYQSFLRLLEERCGTPVQFRNSETPCFFPEALIEKMAEYGRELVGQIVGNREYLDFARGYIPAEYRVPNEAAAPLFVQADFGLDANLEPKLVEIQGFPSLYAYQPTLAQTYRDAYGIDPNLKVYLNRWDTETYNALVRKAIVGAHEAENVVLLEIEPQTQKTLPDFLLTEKYYGVRTVCVTAVKKRGNRLFYSHAGREIPIERIYNRVIVDELLRKKIVTGFDFRDDLEVEWAGHPNWYFLLSKAALPAFNHVSVPQTVLLNRLETLPANLDEWVLKPLFSFAGLGVTVSPTRAEVEAVRNSPDYILQRKVNFVPTVETPHGLTKVEIRVMYIWDEPHGSVPSCANLRAMTALIRMGRGKMMGVDHNRDMKWVGASAAFFLD